MTFALRLGQSGEHYRLAASASVHIGQNLVQTRSKRLKIHGPGNGFKLIAKTTQARRSAWNTTFLKRAGFPCEAIATFGSTESPVKICVAPNT